MLNALNKQDGSEFHLADRKTRSLILWINFLLITYFLFFCKFLKSFACPSFKKKSELFKNI